MAPAEFLAQDLEMIMTTRMDEAYRMACTADCQDLVFSNAQVCLPVTGDADMLAGRATTTADLDQAGVSYHDRPVTQCMREYRHQ